MIDWPTIETAIRSWVIAGSGLDPSKVFFAGQGSTRPLAPFITIQVVDVKPLGRDWTDTDDNPTPTPGNEIITTVRGERECTLQLQCFGTSGGPGSQAFGASSCRALIERVFTACNLPSNAVALDDAGVGIGYFNTVQAMGAIINSTTWEPRAVGTMMFYLASEMSETGTYIETVEVTNEINGDEFTVSRPS